MPSWKEHHIVRLIISPAAGWKTLVNQKCKTPKRRRLPYTYQNKINGQL
jgi:hypothetical protein